MATQTVNYVINIAGNLEAKLRKATSGFDKLNNKVEKTKSTIGKSTGTGGTGLSGAISKLGPIVAAGFAIDQVVKFGKASLEAYNIQEQALAQVRAGLDSTRGVAGRTFEQLQKQASDLQSKTIFGDEEILQGVTAQLLTFTNITKEQFDRTQKAALDLSSRLGTDLKSSSIQLGKALNDPVANLSALSRSGIQFSNEQKTVIKTLAETNRLAEAQTIILDELEKQYGGSAEAAAKAGTGGFKQLSNAFGDFQEKIGGALIKIGNKFLPVLRFLVNNLDDLFQAVKELFEPFGRVFDAIRDALPSFGALGKRTNILGMAFRFVSANLRVLIKVFALVLEGIVRVVSWVGRMINSFLEFVGLKEKIATFFNFLVNSFKALMFGLNNIPAILSAALGAFKDFGKAVLRLIVNIGKNIFRVLRASLDIPKIIKGDLSGIKKATRQAANQIQKDFSNINFRKNFTDRLRKNLSQSLPTEITEQQEKNTSFNAATIPGAGGVTSSLSNIDSEVTGTRSKNINLNITKLVETIEISTTNLGESKDKIKTIVTETLLESLRDTSAIATN